MTTNSSDKRRFQVSLLVPGLIFLAMFMVTGCNGEKAETEQQITLRIAEHPGPHVEPLQNYFIPKYMEETGINIVMEVLPPDQLWQKMALEAQAGTNYYDIGYHSPGWLGYYHESVADLTPFIEKHNFNLDAYSEAVQNSHMRNEALKPGQIIAIARNPQTPIYAYRKDWFTHPEEQSAFQQKYGRPLAAPQTWDELYDIAEFFTRPAGATVAGTTLNQPLFGYSASISSPGGMARAFLAIIYSMGLDGFDADYQTDLDNPILLRGVEYWKNLVENTFPPQSATWNFLEHLEFFSQGRLASAELWPEGVLTAENPAGQAAGNVGYAVLPQWPGNLANLPIGRSFIGGGGILVFDTPRKEEAFKFLQWVYETNEVEFNLRTAMFARDTQFSNQEILESYSFYDTFLPVFSEQMTYGFPRQPIAEWGAVMYAPVGEFASDIIYNVMTPQQAQNRLVQNMQNVFKDAGFIE
ncbi:ABC transporter substrate-binding protein [Spirochaeta dissipatitropha]